MKCIFFKDDGQCLNPATIFLKSLPNHEGEIVLVARCIACHFTPAHYMDIIQEDEYLILSIMQS